MSSENSIADFSFKNIEPYSDNALKIYQNLYYNKEFNEKSPNEVHARVAEFIGKTNDEIERFFRMMQSKAFRPNTPCLINAGKTSENPIDKQLQACFIYGLEDSMESIIDWWKTAALIYASGAGLGIPVTNLREYKAPITGGGYSSGPASYMEVIEVISQKVMSGGKNRRAANLATYWYKHPDIYNLVDLKQTKKLEAFNVSVMVDDFFMSDVVTKDNNLIKFESPHNNNKKNFPQLVPAILWNKIVENCWKNGDPGLLFYDTANRFNPLPSYGEIQSANACGEITLPNWGSCNLGSINLNMCLTLGHDNKYYFDFAKLEYLTKYATIFLDNVIDKSEYLHLKFKETALKLRSLGLGIMGFADILYKLRIPYNSEQGCNLFEDICHTLTCTAIKTSLYMCRHGKREPIHVPEEDKEHFIGLLKHYGCSDGDINDFEDYGIRNSNWTCLPPTGSTALSCDASYSFEPQSALVWTKELADHSYMTFVNKEFENWLDSFLQKQFSGSSQEYIDTKREEIIQQIIENGGSVQGNNYIPKDIQKVFVTAHDISPFEKIDMQAAGQKYISLAISSTCNVPESTTKETVGDIFIYAWKKGLKGITVYRDKCRDWQPINFGKKEIKEPEVVTDNVISEYKRPIKSTGPTLEYKTPYGRLFITICKDENGKVFQIFFRIGKAGTLVNLLLDALSRCISRGLQAGCSLEVFSDTLRDNKESMFYVKLCETDEQPYQAQSIVDLIGVVLEMVSKEINCPIEKVEEESKFNTSLRVCPNCNARSLDVNSGCKSGVCTECGYSSCS